MLLFHAEVDVGAIVSSLDENDPKQYQTFLESRPPSMENEAISMVIELCRDSGIKNEFLTGPVVISILNIRRKVKYLAKSSGGE